jgi:MFS family permease
MHEPYQRVILGTVQSVSMKTGTPLKPLINLLLTPSGALQPILVTRYFNGGAAQLAMLESALGVGAVAGGVLLGVWGGFKRRIVTSMGGIIFLGLGVLAVGLVPGSMFWLAVGLMFFVGVINPIVNGPLFAVVQAIVAPEIQGRVFTLITSFASAMSPPGLLFAAPIADRLAAALAPEPAEVCGTKPDGRTCFKPGTLPGLLLYALFSLMQFPWLTMSSLRLRSRYPRAAPHVPQHPPAWPNAWAVRAVYVGWASTRLICRRSPLTSRASLSSAGPPTPPPPLTNHTWLNCTFPLERMFY